jgi:hypothetical protein
MRALMLRKIYYLNSICFINFIKKKPMNTAILRLFKSSYCVVFYFFLFASFFAHTQEIVIDVEPDEVIVASSTPFSIDFTNDAVDDLHSEYRQWLEILF